MLDLECQESEVMMDGRFDLQRFVDAQDAVYPSALAEIRRGAKRGHWMWFIFPQLKGLGHSAMAERFGIGSWRRRALTSSTRY